MKNSEKTLDMIVNLCKNRGYVYAGSEIYGGLANSWDYGPLGVEFKNNVKKAWLKKFVQESDYNVGLDAAIIMNPQTWITTGHVGFLGALLLALVFLVILWLAVDTNKEQEQDSKLYRFVTHMYIEFAIKVCRVKIHAQGLEKIPTEGRFLLVCNHLSDIDPALLMHCFPKSQLAFVGKKETQQMPVIGAVMHKLLCQYLDRENDREALKSILKCIEIVKEDKASIGVFPEGYVSLDGKLRHFRGGAFKIAQRTGVPIVVCTVRGTWQAMKSMLRLEPAEVEIHLVDVIPGEEAKATPTVEMAERVYEIMISDLGEALRTDEKGMHPDLQKQRMGQ